MRRSQRGRGRQDPGGQPERSVRNLKAYIEPATARGAGWVQRLRIQSGKVDSDLGQATMATTTKLLTAEQFWEFAAQRRGEGKLYELEDGEIVEMPSPSELHGIVCAWIAHILWEYVIKRGQGKGYSGVENLLFYEQNCSMVYGDAQAVLNQMVQAVKDLGLAKAA